MRPVTVIEARARRAAWVQRVSAALEAGQLWHQGWVWCRGSKLARARRHALRCRATAVVLHDRVLGAAESTIGP